MKASKIVFLIFLMMSLCVVNTQPVKSQSSGTIYIRADGSVEGTDKIQRDGNVYTFTSDIFGSIVVERDNITIDGNGYTLQAGTETHLNGIYLSGRENVMVRNTQIKSFFYGIIIDSSSNYNSIMGNNITNNAHGIWLVDSSNNTISGNNITNRSEGNYILSSSNNTISGNNSANNDICITLSSYSNYNTISGNNITDNSVGISLWYSSNNIIYQNYFINNNRQVSIPTSGYANFWDNGVEGNYWSDYEDRYPNATELDDSGVWNTPYIIDGNNQDNYPLMHYLVPPLISIVSPENKTYIVSNVSLTFTVSEPTSWIGYSVNGKTIATITGNTTLTALSDGSHSLKVYAKDTAGNTGTSETIYFSIETQKLEPFPITWIVATIAVIAIGGVALLIYFAKVKKTTGEIKEQDLRE